MSEAIRERFKARFLEAASQRIERLGQLIGDPDNGDQLVHEFHALAGEAAVIGFSDIANEARAAEVAAKGCPEIRALATSARHFRKVKRLVRALAEGEGDVAPTASNPGTSESRAVLIFDDSELVRERLSHTLGENGFRVHTAGDQAGFDEALEGFVPALVVLDLNIPGVESSAVIRQLEQRLSPSPKVIIVSGQEAAEVSKSAQQLGAAGGVSKQDGIDRIVDYLKEL